MRLARTLAAACLAGSLLPLGGVPSACAAEGPSAVLVVDAEDAGEESRYCVALPRSSVSGIELIELAHEQHGLDYRLGYGGNVVCVLAGVGYESDECLTEGPEFWGYWRGDGSGGWDWSSVGGNSTRVEDGDVEGWSWGTGNDGSSHPQPPRTTFASVCGEPAEPAGSSGGKGQPHETDHKGKAESGGSTANDSSSGPVTVADAEETKTATTEEPQPEKRGRKGPRARNVAVATLTPAAPQEQAPSAPTSAEDEGPSISGLLAAVVAAVLLIAGAVLNRRRVRPR